MRPRQVRWSLRPIHSASALELLTTLVRDLFSRVHDYLLPCEAVFRAWTRDRHHLPLDAAAVEAAVVDLIADGRARCASRYGPVPEPERYLPLPAAELGPLLARRWQPLLELLDPATVVRSDRR